jgi:hypothetical protein
MSGLLIKELVARGDLQRCLIVCPGSLAEQWQDELYQRFALPFDILTNSSVVNLLSLSRVCNAPLMASIGHSGRVVEVSSG